MSVVPRQVGIARRVIALGGAVGYIVGIPLLLWHAAHWPLPHRLPTLHEVAGVLTPGQRPGTEVVVKAFAVIAWLLWAQIGIAVVAEMRAQRQGRAAAFGTLPAWTRPFVVRMAATFLTLVPSLGVRPAGAVPAPHPAVTVTVPACPTAQAGHVFDAPIRADTAPGTASEENAATTQYRVRPGDNLWDIAATHLRDPRRYREIFDLNRSRIQPDGRRLTRSGLIRPGWVLELPVAHAPAQPSEGTPGSIEVPPAVAPSTTPQPVDPAPAPPRPAEQPRANDQAEPTPPRREDGSATRSGGSGQANQPFHTALPLLVASSVIAGLELLRRSRRNARRRHHRFPAPPAAFVDVEREVRAVARSEAPRWIAAAARHLAGALAEEGAPPPPEVLALRAGDLGVEVLIAQPWPVAPGRFLPVDDGHTWRLDPDVELDELEELARPVPSYLTALASVGDSETGAVLIDLDHVGTLRVEGPVEEAEAVLGGMALELATAPWADLVDVCLVGPPEAFAGLDRLERVRILDADTAVTALKRCAGSPGVSGLTAAAMGDIPPGPTVAIVWPEALSEDDLLTLSAMAEPHNGLVLVLAEGGSPTPWRLTVGRDRHALLSPLGFALSVPTGQKTIDALASLLVDAATEGVDVPVHQDDEHSPPVPEILEGRRAECAEPFDVDAANSVIVADAHGSMDEEPEALVPDAPAAPAAENDDDGSAPVAEVRILGPVEITWRGPAPQRPQPGELVAYLATHRHRVSGDHVRLALWPARADDDRFGERNKSTLWALTSRTRQALGKDDAGKDLLPKEAGNVLSLSPAVVCDWDQFRQHVDHARRHPAEAIEALVRALDLVRGRPFQDVRSGYAWVELEHLDAEIDAALTDAALDLVDLALAASDLSTARHAIRQGLLGSAGSEPLLRAAMRVAHAAGDQPGVERAWRDIERVTGELGFEPHQESFDLYRTLRRQGAKA